MQPPPYAGLQRLDLGDRSGSGCGEALQEGLAAGYAVDTQGGLGIAHHAFPVVQNPSPALALALALAFSPFGSVN